MRIKEIKIPGASQILVDALESGKFNKDYSYNISSEVRDELLVPFRIMIPYAGAISYKGQGTLIVSDNSIESECVAEYFHSLYPELTAMIHGFAPLIHRPFGGNTRLFSDGQELNIENDPGLRCIRLIKESASRESYPLRYVFHLKDTGTEHAHDYISIVDVSEGNVDESVDRMITQTTNYDLNSERLICAIDMLSTAKCYSLYLEFPQREYKQGLDNVFIDTIRKIVDKDIVDSLVK